MLQGAGAEIAERLVLAVVVDRTLFCRVGSPADGATVHSNTALRARIAITARVGVFQIILSFHFALKQYSSTDETNIESISFLLTGSLMAREISARKIKGMREARAYL